MMNFFGMCCSSPDDEISSMPMQNNNRRNIARISINFNDDAVIQEEEEFKVANSEAEIVDGDTPD